jgi:GPH family glycoside/pentoside/hexuronide:cation symporter
MSNIKESMDMEGIKHSKKIMASYSSGFFVNEVIQGVLLFLLFFFYIVEIGLSPWLTGLAVIIYTLWDAFNDPLIGYLTDRPFKFTKKWGRRFPWIIFGYVPMLISFLLIFTPPNVNAQEQPWIIFGWLAFTLCLFDTCETFFTANYFSLFPDKFRTNEERRKVSAMSIYIGFIGVVFSALLPPMIVVFGDLETYILMAWICISINFFCLFLMLPGVRDDKETVENFIVKFKEREKEPLFKTLKSASKHKSLIAFLLIYMTYLTLTNMVQGSFYFWIRFIIAGDVSDVFYVMLMFLFGSMAGIPLWYYYNKKTGDNRKTMMYSGVVLIFLTVFFSLVTDFITFMILTFIWATALGGFWTFYYVVFSDVIDESIAETGIRREGFYHGIRRFFGNLARAIQAFYFAIVLELTGFREGATVQTPLAKTGILLLIGIIPAITMGVGFIIFLKFYDITPEKSKTIKDKLMRLKM